jgi:hypothetical protein
MIELLVYYLVCYGITAIYIYSSLLTRVRVFVESFKIKFLTDLTNCSMCLGFWVGLGVAFIFPNLPHFPILFLAIASSGVTWMFCSITQFALWGKVFFENFYDMWGKK